MVKPPKTMQPEAVDLAKAGRAAGKAFQDDSFRNYMARKIDMQRKQFGVELPPDPRIMEAENAPPPPQEKQQSSPSRKSPAPILSPQRESGKKRSRCNSNKGVTFAAGVKEGDDSASCTTASSTSNNLLKKKKRKKGGISSIVSRLKRRHGSGRSKKRRRSLTKLVEEGSSQQSALFTETAMERSENNENKSQLLDQLNNEEQENEMKDGVHELAALLENHCAEDDDKSEKSIHITSHELPTEVSPTGHREEVVENQIPLPVANDDNCSDDDDREDDEDVDRILGNFKHNTGEQKTFKQQQPHRHPTGLLKPSPQMRRERPDLFFLGVVVIVNGYTNPDTETIQRLLHKHGGDLEKYETSRITHIVAEHLSTAKANIYKRMRRPIPVVHPNWITDCVAEMRLLPHGGYLIDEVKNKEVTSVKTFFATATTAKKPDTVPKAHPTAGETQKEDFATATESSSRIETSPPPTAAAAAATESPSQTETPPPTTAVATTTTPAKTLEKEVHSQTYEIQEVEMSAAPATNADTLPASTNITFANSSSSKEASKPQREEQALETLGKGAAINNFTTEAPPQRELPPAMVPGRTDDKFINGQIRTTGTDPNFLESFFKNSRLSFIGSYKQRIQDSPNRQKDQAGDNGPTKRFVFHCDMDCFFAAVVLRNYPEYKNKPVAISHFGKPGHDPDPSDTYQPKKNSSSECATCNYEARKFGIKKGMFLGRAKELCPNLVILPYDFEGYEEVSEQVALILQRVAREYKGEVEQVSCDESYLELFFPTEDELCDPYRCAGEIANGIRQEIFSTTRCTATLGVGENKFLSKLATDRAKPNGTFVVRNYKELMKNLKLRDLHGIGYKTVPKLTNEGLVSVQDVWDLGDAGETELTNILGPGLGKKIYAFCKGEDDRLVKAAERKSIGAQCYYGVRFDGPYGVGHMIEGLAKEIEKRMEGVGVRGSRVTLKLKQRKANAKAPPKFLGHGSCHNLSKSLDVSAGPTRDWKVISEIGKILCAELNVPKDDIRGMGMVLTKLDTTSNVAVNDGKRNQSITNWFGSCNKQESASAKQAAAEKTDTDEASAAAKKGEIHRNDNVGVDAGDRSDGEACDIEVLSQDSINQEIDGPEILQDPDQSPRSEESFCDVALPPMSQIHLSQVEALPSPMKRQINTQIAKNNAIESTKQPTKQPVRQAPKKMIAPRSAAPSNKRMRQVSVKRMLKLAELKSAKTSQGGENAISVKDLECLPFEMQLQIANNDSCMLGSYTPANNKRGRSSLSSRRSVNSGVTKQKSSVTPAHKPDKTSRAASPCSQARRSLQLDAGESTQNVPQWEELLSSSSPQERNSSRETDVLEKPEESGPSDFFHENVAPLALFMDENSDALGDALDQVTDFLCLCVREQRLYDAVLLLRNIKNRKDRWGSLSYGHICLAVDHECDHIEGYRLDWEGLGL